MAGVHLLNLRVLASEDVTDYSLLRFEGREAMSEPFDYMLEIVPAAPPADLRSWIGKLVEFDVTMTNGDERVFAGRIYETRQSASAETTDRISLRVRPAYWALAYGRATHFVQDRTSEEIFAAMTADVPGLVADVSLSPAPRQRSYAVRYDETEFDFLDRLLAQDGIMYFFTYDRGAGTFRHKMHVANAPSAYADVPGGDDVLFQPGVSASTIKSLGHAHRAAAFDHDYHAFEGSQLDTPFKSSEQIREGWARVYAHSYEDLAGGALNDGGLAARAAVNTEAYGQEAQAIAGTSDNPAFFPGGRIKLTWADSDVPDRVVMTSVTHSAYDPWMLGERDAATYSNSFTAMDALEAFRPPVPNRRKRAPGPVLGVVSETDGPESGGRISIDEQWRVPVRIAEVLDYSSPKPLPLIVWLPVRQQWAAGSHGAQFFPRVGTRVIVDFLYGEPDLPFVAGTVYTPSQEYPFAKTETGWRSVTDEDGSITQDFRFRDKPGSEEIYLYTGRDYRRLIDNDDWGTVQRDQTLIVERDQKEDINHDQTLTVKNDQTITIENDRTVKVTGVEKTTVQKTRTTTVTQKSLHESMKEIELKVGPSSIKMTMDKIVITSPQIEIKGTATVKVEGGAMLETKAPMAQHNGDGMMIIKGGMVMIN